MSQMIKWQVEESLVVKEDQTLDRENLDGFERLDIW